MYFVIYNKNYLITLRGVCKNNVLEILELTFRHLKALQLSCIVFIRLIRFMIKYDDENFKKRE